MDMRSKVSGRSKPPKKAIGAAKRQSENWKISNFSACKAQGNQHEIRIAFLWTRLYFICFNLIYILCFTFFITRNNNNNIVANHGYSQLECFPSGDVSLSLNIADWFPKLKKKIPISINKAEKKNNYCSLLQ